MSFSHSGFLLGLLFAVFLVIGDTSAQNAWFNDAQLRGIFRVETALETDGDGLQKSDFVIQPELTGTLGDLGYLTVIGRVRADFVDELEPGRPDNQSAARSIVSRRLFVGSSTDVELREAFLDSYIRDVFLRVGKQQIVWGQADGLRVLDIVNPFHFREFILPEFEDRRIPLWTVSAEVPVGPLTAQLLWIPDHSYDDLPAFDATFAIRSPRFIPRPPPSIVGDGPVTVAPTARPDRFIRDDDYGVRLGGFLGGWDFSLNYLYHYQDQAIPFRRTIGAGGVQFQPRYERTHVIGGTFSNAFGDFTLRGEAAYSTDRFFITNAPADADNVFESGELGYVLGLDYQYDADLFISGQVFQSVLSHVPVGAVRDRLDTTFTLLVEKEFLNDTLSAGALLLQSLNDGDGVVELDLEYEWRANIILTLGADLFYGTKSGVFGQFDQNDRVRFGVEYGF